MNTRIALLACVAAILILTAAPVAASVSFSSSTPQIIVQGNDLTVKGTGAMNGTVALWIIGKNHIDRRVIIPDIKGNYITTITSEDTRQFSRGQFAFVIQDSGDNRKLDTEYRFYDNGEIVLLSQGKTIGTLGTRDDLRANLAHGIVTLSANATNPPSDDTFATYFFFVEEPSVDFDHLSGFGEPRLPDVIAGNPVVLGGPTNLDPRDMLRGEIRDHTSGTAIISANIPVQAGPTINRWIWTVDAPQFSPGTYDISVWRQNAFINTSRSAVFTVIEPAAVTTVPVNSTPLTLPWAHDPMLPVLILFGLALVIGSILYSSRNR